MRKRILIATVSSIALLTATPNQTFAGGVPVIDAALIAQQTQSEVMRAYDAAVDYAEQLAHYAVLVDQYTTAITNTLAIPQNAINTVTGYYYRAQNLANTASYIVGPNGSMMQRARMFGGMARGGANMPKSAGAAMAMIREQALSQMTENLQLLGLEDQRNQLNAAMLSSAQSNSAAAVGRMAAIQASAQNTAAAAAQMQSINANLSNMVVAQQVKDSIAIAEDERFGLERTADIEAARAQADNPATIASPITWGR